MPPIVRTMQHGLCVAMALAFVATANTAAAQGGRIDGSVRGAPGGTAIRGATIEIRDSTGAVVSTYTTGRDGTYVSRDLPAGRYRVRTSSALGYAPEAYDNIPCVNCAADIGDEVVVVDGAITGHIDFTLLPPGHITGRVVDASPPAAPLSDVNVFFVRDRDGATFRAVTGDDGIYRSPGLESGDYHVRTSNGAGYVDEAYPNTPCVAQPPEIYNPFPLVLPTGCGPATGNAVTVAIDTTTAGIDFRLIAGGGISGRVVDAGTGAGIGNVSVATYTATGRLVDVAKTDANGGYKTRAGLVAGHYRLRTTNSAGYIDEIYGDIASPRLADITDLAAGTLVGVTDGATTTGTDFALAQGGRISGRVTAAAVGVEGMTMSVFDGSGRFVAQALTSASGTFTTPAIPPGDYRVGTTAAADSTATHYFSEMFDNVPCVACDRAITGTTVPVTAGAITPDIDFILQPGVGIRGTVTDALTGAPLRGVTVEVYTLGGEFVEAATTRGDGTYDTPFGLATGDYRVRTARTKGYLDEAHADVVCVRCATTVGAAVHVDQAGAPTVVDFALAAAGSIAGVVTDADTGLPVDNVGITIADAGGTVVGESFTDAAGAYGSVGLPAGQYRMRTHNAWGYRDEAYDDVPCAGCSATTGELVTIGGAITNGIDFALVDSRRTPIADDTDGDGLPNDFETLWGLDPNDARGVNGAGGADADDDGVTNAQEFTQGTHPRGFFTNYFAEGATSSFFDMQLALLNPSPSAVARTLVRYLRQAPQPVISESMTVGPLTRATLSVNGVAGLATAEVSTVIESDEPLVADRTLSWDAAARYGAHSETAVAAPALTWYLAEGATHSGFNLFYLLQNPNDSAATVRARFFRPNKGALEKSYTLPPRSRTNIWANQESFGSDGLALASTDVSAAFDVTNLQPIVVERAMYLDVPGQVLGAGHESAGVTGLATEWFLAEGNTGPYFDLFVLIANPFPYEAQVTVTYLMPVGSRVVNYYSVAASSRFSIWVDYEDARLADTAVAVKVQSMNGVPIVVERALWWPGAFGQWYEGHNSAGTTSAGTTWAVADGEVGGTRAVETYLLLATPTAFEATVQVTLAFEDGTTTTKTFAVVGNSRFNVDVRREFPEAVDRRFGAIVESLGPNPAPIVVERSMYWDALGQHWAAGTNALAKRLR